jgi:hypothetical protein
VKNSSSRRNQALRVPEERNPQPGVKNMLGILLILLLILALVGVVPTWPHSKNWGYYPTGGIGLVLAVVVVLLLAGWM